MIEGILVFILILCCSVLGIVVFSTIFDFFKEKKNIDNEIFKEIGKDYKMTKPESAWEMHKGNREMIVCLCGSTKFYSSFVEANRYLTMKGYIVLAPGVFGHSSEEVHGETIILSVEQKKYLDELHKKKIKMSDEVWVIDSNGYIGESTKKEIEFAKTLDVPVIYWSDIIKRRERNE